MSPPLKSYRLRRAGASDLPSIRECLRGAFEPFRSEYTAAAFEATVLTSETARQRLAEMLIWVALDAGGVVRGTLSWAPTEPHTGHLRGMAVDPLWQGSGVAQALLDRVLEEMETVGVTRVTLRTAPPLRRAARFYERNGFRPTGAVADLHGVPVREFARTLGRAGRSPAP